jgi:putative ABC transport system permease protein
VEGRGEKKFELVSYLADENFLSTMGISIIKGRGFSKEYHDSASVILNESAVSLFGLSDPIGKIVNYPGGNGTNYRVIGVMKDFNFWSMYSPIAPFALFHSSSRSYTIPSSYVIVRLRQEGLDGTLKMLESEWGSFAPATPFEYSFLDENVEADYRSAERLGQLFLIFSVLTILIACIGLFGLAAFTAQQRTKEIGIRKVLGASEGEVVGLLSKDFVALVVLANLFAIPVGWYIMNQWLQQFAFRIQIGWGVFAIAGGIALVIALLTVSFQAIKTALSNPIDALRYE